MKFKNLLFILMLSALFFSCNDDSTNSTTDDIPTVTIGDQVWMLKNLDVTHYRNGDPIPHVTDSTEWANLTTGAWCNYNNSDSLGEIYGKMYNWYAVNDPRGLAPEGWHVPTIEEWDELSDFLGVDTLIGGEKLRSTGYIEDGTGLWRKDTNNVEATNSSGFTGLPGGCRYYDGLFYDLGEDGYWWAATSVIADKGVYKHLYFGRTPFYTYSYNSENGFSVRCLKD